MAGTDSGFSHFLPLLRPLDEEQARLVEILVAARGSEVSFEELRRQGIENPAVLAYELEIAGLPITHVQRQRAGGRASVVGLRLDATQPLEIPAPERPRYPEPPDAGAAAGAAAGAGAGGGGAAARRAGPRPPRDLAPGIAFALAALVLTVIVIALASGTGSDAGKGRKGGLARDDSHATGLTPAPNASTAPPSSAAARAHRKPSHASRPAPAPPLSPAARLQQAGHVLLAEGRYAAAIPQLRAAINASGESATSCSEPNTPACVAYAEALYDYGRALRLDNAHAAAEAVLRERRRIDSQQQAVQHELGLNRRQRGSAPTSRHPAHTRTPRATPAPKPAPTPHPITGGAPAPAPGASGTHAPASDSEGAGHSAPGGSTAQ